MYVQTESMQCCFIMTDTLTWTEIRVCGVPPPARLDHAMCSIRIPFPTTKSDTAKCQADVTRTEEVRRNEVGSLPQVEKVAKGQCDMYM